MTNDSRIADAPYESGQLVHIRDSAPQDVPELYHHKHACEVVSVYHDYTQVDADNCDTKATNDFVYTLTPVTKDTTLSALYHHSHLLPSPRGYEYVDTLLGDRSDSEPPEWERTLGKFMRQDLELINECLSVVDFDDDPTRDWMSEIRKGDIDPTNSVFAEMLLLYHLRIKLGHDSVRMNALFSGDTKDVDIRVTMDDWDVWIEVYKPDYIGKIPEGGEFISTEATGTSVGNKLRKKFNSTREQLPEDAVVILAVYLVEELGQSLQLTRWLDQEYFDVGEYCDGLLTFSHLSFPTEFTYLPITSAGEDCGEFFESVF